MNWFFASGDLDFFWKEQLQALSWLPQVFRSDIGLGTSGLLSLWLDYPFRLILKLLADQGFTWFFIEKFLWLSVFIVGGVSSYRCAKYFLGKTLFSFMAPVIYMANTYVLLLFGGGQLGVAWAYACAPLVLVGFIETIDARTGDSLGRGIANGLALSLLIAFDIRLAYIVLGMVGVYTAIYARFYALKSIGVSLAVSVSLHAFWILPLVFSGDSSLIPGRQFTDPGMLTFLSFADFSHSLSLLHPNWPENLFGRVYFLQPEFLVLPILAFSSLIFLPTKKRERTHLLFLAGAGLAGVFFAKGTHEPFGEVFRWMFIHVPGFISFRDPTKFYLCIALSYSVLIPCTLREISRRLQHIPWIIPLTFLSFWVFTVRAVVSGNVEGNFKPVSLPQEYTRLKNFLIADPVPSRTLWIPQKEKFAYYSVTHPFVLSNDLFPGASVSAMIRQSAELSFMNILSESGIRYVIVPQDVEKRMFMEDYRFTAAQRDELVAALGRTPLKRRPEFRDIAVFENDAFIMRQDMPATLVHQQRLANAGVAVSALSLLICIGVIHIRSHLTHD